MDWIKDIENYEPYNEQEIKDKDLILKCIKLHDDILTRENTIAHITSSGYIVNKSRTKVLIIKFIKVGHGLVVMLMVIQIYFMLQLKKLKKKLDLKM